MRSNRRGFARLFLLSGLWLAVYGMAEVPADPPAGWSGGGEGYELSLDRNEKRGGKASGSVKATADAKNFGTLMQVFDAEDFAGKRIRLSAYVKTKDSDDWVGLWMRIDGKEKTGLAFDNMQDRKITGATDWKKYDVVLDVPKEAVEIYFGVLLAGKGQIWVNSFKVEAVGNDVMTTGMATQGADRTTELIKDLPKAPKNLDFEL